MAQCFLCVLILVTTVKCGIYHLLPKQSDACNVDCHDCLTLSQFVSNSSNYLTNNTTLIFAPGCHTMESELTVHNIHSFSMLAETTPLTETEVICYGHAKFKFSNVSVVTMSNFKFSECTESKVQFVHHFFLKKSTFYGRVNVSDCGTILTMVEAASYLDRVSFTFQFFEQKSQNYTMPMILQFTDICPRVILYTDASTVTINQSSFTENHWQVLYSKRSSKISISSSIFTSNLGSILNVTSGSTLNLNTCSFKKCKGDVLEAVNAFVEITNSLFFNTSITFYISDNSTQTSTHIYNSRVLSTKNTNMRVNHSRFIGNANNAILFIDGGNINIDHCQFTKTITSTTLSLIIILNAKTLSIKHNEFKNNNVSQAIVNIYDTESKPIENCNEFADNNATFEIYISSECKSGLSLSLDSSRCISCPKHWRQNLIGLVIAAFVTGLVLVFIIFVFNLTIAIGTLNGILLYSNIIAANADTYFLPFSSPNFATVFISWLNLDAGFDICFFKGMDNYDKAQIQLAFPVYIILLVIIIIIFSERSTKFARIIGRGNPIAVLTTMILLSYTKFFNVIIGSIALLYFKPAYGSRNLNITNLDQLKQVDPSSTAIGKKHYSMLIFAPIIFLLGVLYTTLVFSWQWLLPYQHKLIFKWVKYQKLQHFLEPHHAPYTSKHRYWTGLLLIVRFVLFFEGVLNFSKDPQIDLIATIGIITCLLLLKGSTSMRVYKNWLIDIMENAIFFNLILLAMLTWYCLNSQAEVNQSAITYTSITITFILLLMVIVFHALRYTRLHKCPSVVHKIFVKVSSKLSGREEMENDIPIEVEGYQPEKADRKDGGTVTYTVVELQESLLN